jgi:SNF family Na+-dependent transporter
MSLKMRYYYIVGIWSFCFVLPIMMGCMREEKKSSKDSFEMLYQQMELVPLNLRNKFPRW